MNYAESIIWLRTFLKDTEHLLNLRKYEEALDKAEHIEAEAKQLVEDIKKLSALERA